MCGIYKFTQVVISMKNYKKMIAIPIIIFVLCGVFLLIQTNNGLLLDIDLKGGTQISIDSQTLIDENPLKDVLDDYDVNIRTARGVSGYSTLIEFSSDIDSTDVINTLENAGYNLESYSVQSISPVLSESFFSQAIIALILAFVFMAVVILFIFKSPILSFYTSLCPAFDIIEVLAITQLLGIKLSLASFAALLMIVGYSVDDDVMIASRVLKRGDISIDKRYHEAFKTSVTTTSATLVALIALFLLSLSSVITQIAIVLLIGLLFDFMNTWLFNVNLLRWHAEKKGVA